MCKNNTACILKRLEGHFVTIECHHYMNIQHKDSYPKVKCKSIQRQRNEIKEQMYTGSNLREFLFAFTHVKLKGIWFSEQAYCGNVQSTRLNGIS